MKQTISKILYTTLERDGSTMINFEEVQKTMLDVYKGVMPQILTGKRFVLTKDETCYVVGSETLEGVLVADLYHTSYKFALIRVYVYPPEVDSDFVRAVTDMSGITKLQDLCNDIMTDDIRETLRFFGDTGRSLAWVWLVYRGYVDTFV